MRILLRAVSSLLYSWVFLVLLPGSLINISLWIYTMVKQQMNLDTRIQMTAGILLRTIRQSDLWLKWNVRTLINYISNTYLNTNQTTKTSMKREWSLIQTCLKQWIKLLQRECCYIKHSFMLNAGKCRLLRNKTRIMKNINC